MKINVLNTTESCGASAALAASKAIRGAINARGEAIIVLATGASQLEMLSSLVHRDIDWSKVTAFHLDEYIGLGMEHPASFCRYLKERFANKVGNLRELVYVNGSSVAPDKECTRLGVRIGKYSIDVACVGIGENGHLAFNDPPADFETPAPYHVVELDEECRNQQIREEWFSTLEDVPTKAISMSIRQILKADTIVCTVPDERKAQAVVSACEGPVTNMVPASILQTHGNAHLFLDSSSASKLTNETN